MNDEKYILVLESGFLGSSSYLITNRGDIYAKCFKPINQISPQAQWLENDPQEIWESQLETAQQLLKENNVSPQNIVSIGITTQRETIVMWDKHTGKPVYNAILWIDRRTKSMCDELVSYGFFKHVKETTGLFIDPYFSATKIKWILDNVEGVVFKANDGDLLVGTVDTWLLWNLTKGKVHATDYSNASRTMLYDIKNLCWDEKILNALLIPQNMLAEVKATSGHYGETDSSFFDGVSIPITAMAGDQQAALFGQGCFDVGLAKATYKSGCFMLMNTGNKIKMSKRGLLTSIAWGIGNDIEYILEGTVFDCGFTITWLKEKLGLISTEEEAEQIAKSVENSNSVYMVPAFRGLGAPYWDRRARAILAGISEETDKEHIVRAALEAIAYRGLDILQCLQKDSGINIAEVKVGGAISLNNFVMQFQSDISNLMLVRPKNLDTPATGVAFLAGLAVGFWNDKKDVLRSIEVAKMYSPLFSDDEREHHLKGWKKAVLRSKLWEDRQKIF